MYELFQYNTAMESKLHFDWFKIENLLIQLILMLLDLIFTQFFVTLYLFQCMQLNFERFNKFHD